MRISALPRSFRTTMIPPELGDELPDLVETSDDEDEKPDLGATGSFSERGHPP